MIYIGLAAWRFAHLIVADTIVQPLKQRLIDNLQDKATENTKLVGLAEKVEEGANCIYCVTFWTSLILLILLKLTKSNTIIKLGAIWAIATLIGATHNTMISYARESDEETDHDKVD